MEMSDLQRYPGNLYLINNAWTMGLKAFNSGVCHVFVKVTFVVKPQLKMIRFLKYKH